MQRMWSSYMIQDWRSVQRTVYMVVCRSFRFSGNMVRTSTTSTHTADGYMYGMASTKMIHRTCWCKSTLEWQKDILPQKESRSIQTGSRTTILLVKKWEKWPRTSLWCAHVSDSEEERDESSGFSLLGALRSENLYDALENMLKKNHFVQHDWKVETYLYDTVITLEIVNSLCPKGLSKALGQTSQTRVATNLSVLHPYM